MSQHRRSPVTQAARRRQYGAGRRRTSVVAGLGMLFFAVAGTAAILGVQDGAEDETTRSAASAGENRADGQHGQDGQDGQDGQESRQRTRTAALEEAEQSDQAREKAALERAQAQDRRTKQAEAAHTAQKEQAAQQQKKAREKAAAKRAAAGEKEKDAPEKKNPGGGGAEGTTANESKLIALLNERRKAMGLNPVEESAELATEAKKCSTANLAKDGLEHCGHEVLFQGGENTTPEAMLEAWFNSPGHKTALTYTGSTKAGGAIVKDPSGKLVSAINIDY